MSPRTSSLPASVRLSMAAALLATALVTTAAAEAQAILTRNLTTPFKITQTPGRNFLVAETGSGAHDGELTLVAGFGGRYTLLSGLPSGVTPEGVIGPTGVAEAHTTVYVLIGEGDVLGPSPDPTRLVPNPEGLSSPIFSSLLRARFTPVPDGIREGFELTPEDRQALADGHTVILENGSGERVELLLLTDFRDLAPDPFSGVRQANPFAVAIAGSLTVEDLVELGVPDLDVPGANFGARLQPDSPLGQRLIERTRLYVVDAGMSTVSEVSAATGRSVVLARLAPFPNPAFPGLGGPVVDPVPTGVRVLPDGDLLIATLSGFPFAPGAAKILHLDIETGAVVPLIEGLTSVTDVLQVGSAYYVIEVSTNLLAGAPGRLLRIPFPGATPEVVAPVLIGPTGLVHDVPRGEVLVTETFTGLVKRFPVAD